MLSDPGVCPSLAKDGAPRCAFRSFCSKIPVSALLLAGVGMLIAFLGTLGCLVRAPDLSMSMAEGDTLISVDYEIFGKVQGVFFRKYTQVLKNKYLFQGRTSQVAQWEIPWTEEPGGLQSKVSQRIGNDLATKQQYLFQVKLS
ncbi:acylphosphatase-1 isoform X2 [Moschus berezovskii]|uniref:acylphosphatase-1 isoform X2 n=1 Tax=Moschus berezovskii TaxID=68408 RepID=UPI002443B095|nr:acylphosphatase-1 isoform X2 [Moschus berezovskii]